MDWNLSLLFVFGHLLHWGGSADGLVRRLFLRFYIRYEVSIFKLALRFIYSRWSDFWIFKKLFMLFIGYPVKKWGETGYPLLESEVKDFIASLPDRTVFSLGDCRCRLSVKGPCERYHQGLCSHPLPTEIGIGWGAVYYKKEPPKKERHRVATREEILRVIDDCLQNDLIPCLYSFCIVGGIEGREYVICNCCKGRCAPILFRKKGMNVMMDGHYQARALPESCTGCGDCLESCPLDAISIDPVLKIGDCFGCGLCAKKCPIGAIEMVPRQAPLESSDRSLTPLSRSNL